MLLLKLCLRCNGGTRRGLLIGLLLLELLRWNSGACRQRLLLLLLLPRCPHTGRCWKLLLPVAWLYGATICVLPLSP